MDHDLNENSLSLKARRRLDNAQVGKSFQPFADLHFIHHVIDIRNTRCNSTYQMLTIIGARACEAMKMATFSRYQS